jgi:hypothetical protein
LTSPELDNLARIGKLKREPATDDEISGLLRSAEERLGDAARFHPLLRTDRDRCVPRRLLFGGQSSVPNFRSRTACAETLA